MTRRVLLLSIGILCLAGGAGLSAPGAAVIRWGFVIEGALLAAAAFLGFPWPRVRAEDLFERPIPLGEDIRRPLLWLAIVTLAGGVLRFYRLGSDLWLDEITTVLDYKNVSPWTVITHYTSSNNHLFNTLAIKTTIALFGPAEWAIRLPAVLLGIAGIPAIYALSRIALRRREALFAAVLFSVSYHGVFFSQNARGYTGLLFWSMLGTTFFLNGLMLDRVRDWVLYIVSMFLAVATVLYGVFVIAGHVLAFGAAMLLARRRGKRVGPLAGRLLIVWGILGILCLQLYAGILSQVNTYAETVYRTKAVGYALFSIEHVHELWRGLSAGFGGVPSLGVIALLGAVGLGSVWFLRRQPLTAWTLVAPLLVTAAFLLARGLRFSPRFFLWALPVAWIFAAAAPAALSASRAVAVLAVAAMALLSVSSLPAYYRVPKQPNRASLDWVLANRGAGDPIAAAYLAKWGLRFYGPDRGLVEGKTFFVVQSEAELEDLERSWSGHTIWLMTTFPRALRLEYPDLDRAIGERYQSRRIFDATIGDGQIEILTRRASP